MNLRQPKTTSNQALKGLELQAAIISYSGKIFEKPHKQMVKSLLFDCLLALLEDLKAL
jgi:hypothetical protein